MGHLQSVKKKMDDLVRNHEDLCLSQFLQRCREIHKLSLNKVFEETDILISRMYHHELGFIGKTPKSFSKTKIELKVLAEFYEIDVNILYKKFEEYKKRNMKYRKIVNIR